MLRIEAVAELEIIAFGRFHGRRVIAAIRKQLPTQAHLPSRHRKKLHPIAEYAHLEPVWQLSVGEYRVHYRIMESARTVVVFHAFWKGRRTTEEAK